jgi:hypothetical protein
VWLHVLLLVVTYCTADVLLHVTGAQGQMDLVCAATGDKEYTLIAFGDTSGHIRVWDVSQGIDTSSAEACSSSFKQVHGNPSWEIICIVVV